MPNKSVRLYLLLVLLVFSSCTVVYAASYDGTYNYAFNLNGPSGWEEHTVPNGFIVNGGVISSNPSALSGTVDSAGNVRFTGPSPYGSPTATFTGTISSDGSGSGSYVDSQGLRGNWAVQRTSGGGFGWLPSFSSIFYDFIYRFAFVGEAIGLSGSTAAIVGSSIVIAAGIVGVTFAFVAITTRGQASSKGVENTGRRTGEYVASEPDTPQRTQGAPAIHIGVPPPSSPPMGVSIDIPGLPDSLNLRAEWANQRLALFWTDLAYDATKYELQGFEVTKLYYDGSSTSANRAVIDRLDPGSRYWNGAFNQTYRWNTGGDLQGYRVDAIFRDIVSEQPRYLRIGETSYAPYSMCP